MTSHQFSATKKAADYDFRVALKSIIIPTVITFIFSVILFVVLPLDSVFTYYFDNGMNIEKLRREMVLALTATNAGEFVGINFLLLGILFAVAVFSFTKSKKAVNVFFSTSIDRRTLFKNRVLASVLMITASTALPIIVDMLINIFYLGNSGYVIQCAIALFAETFVYTFAGFAIAALAMILCTTFIESLFFGVSIIAAPTVVVYFIDSFCDAFLKGYYHNELFSYSGQLFVQPSLFHYTSIINPLLIGKAYGAEYAVGHNIFNFVYRFASAETADLWSYGTSFNGVEKPSFDYILPIIVWAVIGGCLVFITGRLFIKSKAENTGVHGSSAFAQRFFALICSVAACSFWVDGLSFIYSDLGETAHKGATVALAAVIVFGIYALIISISKRKIKHKINELILPFSAVCGMVVFFFILSAGAFGYSTYVPEVDEIEKAVITTSVIDATTNEFEYAPASDTYYDDIFPDYYSDYSALGVFDDEEDLKLFTDINKNLVEETDNMTGSCVCVYYMLKNGKTVSRFYDNTDYDASYRILSLRDSKAVKEELTYLLTGNVNDMPMSQKIELMDWGDAVLSNGDELSTARVLQGGRAYAVASNGLMNGNLIDNTPELRQALLADLLSQTYEQRYKPSEAPIGGLFFSSSAYNVVDYDDSQTEELLRQELGADVYESYFEGGFYIYPSMTNTVAYLESTGEYDLFAPPVDEILSVSIENCKTVRNKQFELWGSEATISRQFITLNQYFTNVKDFAENEYGEYELNTDYYYDYYTTSMPDYFKNGVTVSDEDKIAELMAKSRSYYYSGDDDYIVMFNYKDAGYVSRLVPAADVPEWALNKNVNA